MKDLSIITPYSGYYIQQQCDSNVIEMYLFGFLTLVGCCCWTPSNWNRNIILDLGLLRA